MIGVVSGPLHHRHPLFVARLKGSVRNELDERGILLWIIAICAGVPQSHSAIGMTCRNNTTGMVRGIEAAHHTRSVQGQQTVLSLHVPYFEAVVPATRDELFR